MTPQFVYRWKDHTLLVVIDSNLTKIRILNQLYQLNIKTLYAWLNISINIKLNLLIALSILAISSTYATR